MKSGWPRQSQAATASGGALMAVSGTPLLYLVVWRFARDDHVVHVAFAQARDRDPHETGALLQLDKRTYATVTHSTPEPADQLRRQSGQRTFVRDAAFARLGH